MPKTADYYEGRAEECRVIAEVMTQRLEQRDMLQIADEYERLALQMRLFPWAYPVVPSNAAERKKLM